LGSASSYVKGVGVIATCVGAPEVGIPIYQAGSAMGDCSDAIKLGYDFKEGNTKDAAIIIGSQFVGRAASYGIDKSGLDQTGIFISGAAADQGVEKVRDELEDDVDPKCNCD
jgi:hypothetical protein